MRFDIGTLDSGERSLPFGLLVSLLSRLRLGQLCIQNIHNIFQENVPEDKNPICPAMPEIKIDLNGVLKLLSNLNPDKAAGPDSYQTSGFEIVENGDCPCYLPLV